VEKFVLDLCVNNAQQIKLSVISIAYIMGRAQNLFIFLVFFLCLLFILVFIALSSNLVAGVNWEYFILFRIGETAVGGGGVGALEQQ